MKARAIVQAGALAIAAAVIAQPSGPVIHARTEARNVVVDPSHVWSQWQGWGSSLCWWAHALGGSGNASVYADLIYTMKQVDVAGEKYPGLGFNIVRYNVGGGGIDQPIEKKSPRMPSFRDIHGFWINPPTAASPSGVWDWSIDQNQRAIMRMAQERGADVFELFSNSPMWWMNSNNSSDGNEGGDCLKPDQENNFAKYLATVVRHARDDWSIHFQSAEAFNEPAAGWWKYPGTQEGCNFSRDTQARMIAKLRSELDSDGLKDVIVSASDENDADAAVSTWNDFDQATRARIGRVNVHGYFAGTNPYRGGNMTVLRDEIANSKPIWMSEYGDNDASGATMAQSIIFDIRGLHPSAWVYWQPVEPHRSGWGLINADYQDSSPEPAPASTPLAQINRKFFVFGQFTRYVRPGWQIIDIDDSNSIAAYDSAQHHLVIVTKTGPAPARMDLDLTRFKRIGGTYLIVTTSLRDTAQPDRKLAIEGPLKIDDARQKKFSPELYPNAVETFVMDAVY